MPRGGWADPEAMGIVHGEIKLTAAQWKLVISAQQEMEMVISPSLPPPLAIKEQIAWGSSFRVDPEPSDLFYL